MPHSAAPFEIPETHLQDAFGIGQVRTLVLVFPDALPDGLTTPADVTVDCDLGPAVATAMVTSNDDTITLQFDRDLNNPTFVNAAAGAIHFAEGNTQVAPFTASVLGPQLQFANWDDAHQIEVWFDEEVDDAAIDPANYQWNDEDGIKLPDSAARLAPEKLTLHFPDEIGYTDTTLTVLIPTNIRGIQGLLLAPFTIPGSRD